MDEFEAFYIKAAHFLKYRPRSVKEVRDKLLQKKASIEVIEKILDTLKKQKFLDDEAFTKWWIRQRTEFRPKSKRIIQIELLQKGVTKEIIDRFTKEEEATAVSDIDQAKKLIESRKRRFAHLDKKERRQKMIEYLARRGFDWDTIRKSVDEKTD